MVFLLCAGGQHAVDIAREDVDFDIQLSSGRDVAERRLVRRMRDDIDREVGRAVVGFADVVDGQRHAVEGDRAFGCNHDAKFAGDGNANSNRIAFGGGADDIPYGINMAVTIWPPSSSPIRSERSRLSFAPSRHKSFAVRDRVSPETSTANQSSPLSTTVRHT